MAVIVRNDRGKVLARFSKVGAYIDLRGVKQRMTPTEAATFAHELWLFAGLENTDSPGEVADYIEADRSGPSCEVCGKTFKNGRGMAGHARTHQDVAAQELGVA